MSRKFRPVSQSGMYSVRGSEIARSGNSNPNRIRCVVELQDDSEFIIDLDKNAKGEFLYQELFKHLELLEREFFGLEFLAESPDRMQWLNKEKPIKKQVKGSPPYVFYFRVRFFVSDPAKLSEDLTRYQFYLQVKRDILTGKLPCLYDTAAELASYVLQSELGDYDPRIQTETYVSEFRFIPDQTEDFEERVAEFHKHHIGQSPSDAEFNYLEVAKSLDLYGVDLHFAKDHDDTDLYIGISPLGITVYHNKCKINFFPWSKIIKVCFKRKRFFLQIRPDWNEWTDNIIGFHMTTYRACKNMWKTCVEYHSFYRTHYPKPSDKRVIRIGSKYRYKGKTEYQAIEEGRKQPRVEPKITRTLSRRYSRRSEDGSSYRSRSKISDLDRDISRENPLFTEKVLSHHHHIASSCSSPERIDSTNRLHVDGGEQHKANRSPESQRKGFNSGPASGEDSGGDSPVKNGSTPLVGLISVRLEPDEAGRFGFNVQGGRDVNLPVIVSKIAPGTPADLCMPQLQEGDEITLINGQDVKGLTHRDIVELIKSISHSGKKVLMLSVRPNVFVPPEAQFEDSRVISPEQHQVATNRRRQEIQDERRSRIVTRDEEALRVSLDQLRENLESGDLLIYFQELYRKKPGMSCENARKPENLPKNRYRDILPYDDTRVKLYKSRSDYINANYVSMEVTSKGHLNRYIAAQGPLEKTCGDFWQMVWEQEATLVVMLTTTIERGRVKCHQYWPEGEEALAFGDLEIVCTKIRDFSPSYIYREMYVTDVKSLRSRVVVQLQYIAWPDHDVPDDASDFIDFVHSVRHYREGTNTPVVVHCSAGVGRSGVLMFMETAYEMIEGAEPIYPLEIVRRMRDQRASSIQTPGQFLFCCEATLKSFNEGIVKPLRR